MTHGWNKSAEAWVADMGMCGDFARTHVLDEPMLARVTQYAPKTALDVGCGEGRFCRMLVEQGIDATGLDPTEKLLCAAQQRDPDGSYVKGMAEALPFEDASYDLVISYLSLIDIEGFEAAITEMARVLNPGGHLLIANLNSFATALPRDMETSGWVKDATGKRVHFALDDYLKQRASWVSWRDIRVLNYHRPLRDYMAPLLASGLQLRSFDEPAPWKTDGQDDATDAQTRVPYFVMMGWQKPER